MRDVAGQPIMNKDSIAFLLPKLGYGGAESVCIQVANALSNSMDVFIITKDPKGPRSKAINAEIKVITYSAGRFSIFSLLRKVRQTKPSILFSTFWDLNVPLVLCRPLLFPSVKIILREAVSPQGFLTTKPMSSLILRLYAMAYRRANRVIAPSRSVAREIEGLCRDRINAMVILNAPDHNRLKAVDEPQNQCCRYAITVGRLDRQKRHHLLVEAFSKVAKSYPDLALCIVGSGPLRSDLQRQIDSCGLDDKVTIRDPDHDVLKLVKGACLYISTSAYEGLSNAMLEALCLGVPTIATTQHTSASEVIVEGDNGFVIPGAEVDVIEDTLLKALRNLETFDREKISRDIIQKLNITPLAEQYQHAIQATLQN